MCVAGTTETVQRRAAEHQHVSPGLSRRQFLRRGALAGAGAAVAATLPALPAAASTVPTKRVQDLTHVFRDGFPVYGFDNPSRQTLVTVPNDGFYAQQWTFAEHSGTHLDAPGHFVEGNRLVDELRAEELIVPLVVIDISARAADDADAEVTPDDVHRFEHGHGRIPRGALVCMYSGWEERVGSQDDYRNTGPDGKFHFPGFGIDAVDWLLGHRQIAGVGVDTLSLDNGPSQTFAVHFAVLGADRYGVENLRNLSRIPPRGATAFVGVIPWEEGSGGPCRVIARW